jgi:hypothetical protein
MIIFSKVVDMRILDKRRCTRILSPVDVRSKTFCREKTDLLKLITKEDKVVYSWKYTAQLAVKARRVC